MRTKHCLTVVFLVVLTSTSVLPLHAQDVSLSGRTYFGDLSRMQFGDQTVTFSGVNRDTAKKFSHTYPYVLVYDHRVPYLRLKGADADRWLVLFSDKLLFAYNSDRSYPFFEGTTDGPGSTEALIFYKNIEVTSHLVEGSDDYGGANLKSDRLWEPWVEGVRGPGIGQSIDISPVWSPRVVISNGFVSYDKPYLYTANNRVKEFIVEDESNGGSYTVEVADTPCPQFIYLRKSSEHIKLVIKSVYPGEKWDDTAINFLVRF